MYRKLKRITINGHASYIPNFKKAFPELSKLDNEDLADRWNDLGIVFYTEEKKPVSFWMRITLPFALILMILMLILLPINFLITGYWGYSLNNNNNLINWFRALRLQ